MRAGALFAATPKPRSPTSRVSGQNVSRWHVRWRQGGQALRQGARAHGFDTDHWTLDASPP
jgi:hypothetical protein